MLWGELTISKQDATGLKIVEGLEQYFSLNFEPEEAADQVSGPPPPCPLLQKTVPAPRGMAAGPTSLQYT